MTEPDSPETLVVFESGCRRLAFKALSVRSMTAGELWIGNAPLHLGQLLSAGPGVFERRTRVLELETSDEESVAVLVRGPMSIRTVRRSAVRSLDQAESDPSLRSLADAIFDDGNGQVIVVAPDRVREFVRTQSEPPAKLDALH